VAVGTAGARNAALLAAAILAGRHAAIGDALERYRRRQTDEVLARPDPRQD
jgi:5-(carboxyamino)imidazole ribonucleotide mutase